MYTVADLREAQMVLLTGLRFGRTTSLAKTAQENQWTFVVHDREFAKTCQAEFKAKTVHFSPGMHNHFRGMRGPYIFDHHLFSLLLADAIDRIERLDSWRVALESEIGSERVADLKQRLSKEFNRHRLEGHHVPSCFAFD